MPILSIRHVTRYRYRTPVALGEHRMMLRPRESYDQRILSCDLTITPTPERMRSVHDVFGNCVSIAGFTGRTEELIFDSRVRLDHTPLPAFADVEGEVEVYTGAMPFDYSPEDLPDLEQSMQRHYPDPEGLIDAWARRFVKPVGKTSLQTLLSDMTQAIYAEFKYNSRLARGIQDPLETLALRSGTCRDYAILMIEAARSLGLAARFVSGYIYSPMVGAGLSRASAGHTHAWVRVYLPACGWVEFDPTNGIVGNADLVRVAIARDPRQAVPLHGSWSGQAADYLGMEVEVDVRDEGELDVQPMPFRAIGAEG
ncbi:MAG: transglutaminase family protein [Phenylobacterium sp.]|uniref:transglutaminase family protein n=1 Tax=Phenylobacterium sp. TaxID=1871053 RepID=UPI0027170BE5|nr:transglutaminase family protein [Phenylobacterium sp.]MDO8913918.1 transglutaminase family protein [Phenylobacterium sp.]MDP3100399.1 transglutaminase family protein [Phenylobacterium sp.]MDP3866746.1 transglutaminase family protein [Phenylobacterium sp.]